jgi:hypothetical protein
MTKHFLFTPGCWLGQGTIVFSTTPEELVFFMRWTISASDQGQLIGVQEIELKGGADKMINQYTMTMTAQDKYNVLLENDILGRITGTGYADTKIVAWEFRRTPADFEGIEIYELQPDGNYVTRAEYITSDQYRTTIRGKLWHQLAPQPS